ncbi:MAG: molybdopterin dinucleotide binding domain-containing protein [Bacteroidales bacterium]
MIKVFNDLGSIVTRVRITGRLGKGLVVLHNGIWLADGGGGNTLTSARETDIASWSSFSWKQG